MKGAWHCLDPACEESGTADTLREADKAAERHVKATSHSTLTSYTPPPPTPLRRSTR